MLVILVMVIETMAVFKDDGKSEKSKVKNNRMPKIIITTEILMNNYEKITVS